MKNDNLKTIAANLYWIYSDKEIDLIFKEIKLLQKIEKENDLRRFIND